MNESAAGPTSAAIQHAVDAAALVLGVSLTIIVAIETSIGLVLWIPVVLVLAIVALSVVIAVLKRH